MSIQVALGSDHAGYEEKEKVKYLLEEMGIGYTDFGTDSGASVDYPDYAQKVAEAVADDHYDQGILICGSGTGMAIAANKVHGIRAAVAWNEETAGLAREHNNANVLALGARTTSEGEIAKILKAWFHTDFAGGRHQNRIDKIAEIERSE